MRYILFILLPIILFAQVPIVGGSRAMLSFKNLGEDTEIVMQDPKTDTVYTIDDDVMDIRPDRIALSEMYYPIDEENVVAIGTNGKPISLEEVPIKGFVRAKLVKRGKKFVVVRIRVLKEPLTR